MLTCWKAGPDILGREVSAEEGSEEGGDTEEDTEIRGSGREETSDST